MEGEKIEFQDPGKGIFWNSGKMFASLQMPSTSSTAFPGGRRVFDRTAETTLFPLISVSDCWDWLFRKVGSRVFLYFSFQDR